MTKEEYLSILRQGAEVWNSWREEVPELQIDLSGVDFTAISPHINFEGINFSYVCLKYTNFSLLQLKKTNFAFANLEGANFLFSNLEYADLRGTNLKSASFEDADIQHALLTHADLYDTLLSNANCKGADFSYAFLKGTDLSGANLENAKVTSVNFEKQIFFKLLFDARFVPSEMWKRRLDFFLDTRIRCMGVHTASCYGSQGFIQFLRDVDYLEEIYSKVRGSFLIFIWWVFADCGRSLGRWAFWTLIIILLFALLFLSLGEEHFALLHFPFTLPTMLYFSIINFTTYGSTDISPVTWIAALLSSIEVIFGYMMFGGLISIFSSKIARRAG
ncbi:MAG: hypothetical protein HGB36_06140 [Chlorobiaceae bacterium]|nr:hypothetical protein [Chlorobiaceae bacterium]